MAIGHTLGRMAATLVAIVRTRLELAVVEMEEESLRFLSLLAPRPTRLLPVLMGGAALWKSARGALPLVRRIASRFNR
jgi:uncharacterized membrane protein YqjE